MIDLKATDVRRLNWFGAKPLVAAILAARPINPVIQLLARTALPARIAHRLPLSRRHVEYRLRNGQSIRLLDPLHDLIARDIHWGGGRPTSPAERHKLGCIERLSEDAATFLDVGAFAGLYALIAARTNPRLRAVAYEIVPENFALIERNIAENHLARQIEAKLTGIGEKPGSIRLPEKMGGASFMTSISLGSSFDAGVEIPVSTLDLETRDISGPFVVKIDVEGYERQVFSGGIDFIRNQRPEIVCEILPDARDASAAIEALVRPLGYRTFTFEADGISEHSEIATRETLRDWLITPRADVQQLWAD